MRANEPFSRSAASLDGAAYARPRPLARRAALAGGVLALALLAGCNQTSRMHTGSIKPSAASADVGAPRAVMRQMAIAHSDDREVLSAYGKALAAAGDLPKALETVRRAQTPDRPDWRLLSAEGAILDQLGQADKARVLYEKALVIQPNEPSILSNLGMSYLLANDLPKAESYLSRAVALPGADSRVRQNLALVMGLQGRFDEAERTASAVLSPDEAKANVAYLRQMLSQKNTWSELAAEDRG